MSDPTVVAVTGVVNAVALVAFLVLLGACLFSMTRRILDYRRAQLPLPTVLKRGLVLFAALALIGGEAALLRAAGIVLEDGSLERLLFTVQSDLILLTALGYYTKAELFDLDDDSKP